jgi:hypothetical protein
MTILSKSEKPHRDVEIDLTGLEGNVFCLIGYAKRFAKQLGLPADEIAKDMMSNDYEHAVSVFENHFGSVVTLYR